MLRMHRDVRMPEQPIAIFDSGLGGLTVVREVRRRLPGKDIVYFGDTARVPYGSKSPQTVLRFASEASRFLLRFEPCLIIAACNTASALTLDALEERLPVPVLGVVKPGAAEAVRRVGVSSSRPIGVIATEATVNSHAYTRAIHEHAPHQAVIEQACPSLVAVIEEGRSDRDPIVRMLLIDYLEKIRALHPGALVLGCTHYPLIKRGVADIMGDDVLLIDSAEATAQAAEVALAQQAALSTRDAGGRLRSYVSDNPQRFREVGSRFLGEPITDVAWISPEQLLSENLDTATISSSGV
jgi:glutamate racemase